MQGLCSRTQSCVLIGQAISQNSITQKLVEGGMVVVYRNSGDFFYGVDSTASPMRNSGAAA
jgi:hypothetical protein